jgi:hypothetical protein
MRGELEGVEVDNSRLILLFNGKPYFTPDKMMPILDLARCASSWVYRPVRQNVYFDEQ